MSLEVVCILPDYGWPLNNTGLNCAGPLTCRLFTHAHTHTWFSRSLVSAFWDSTKHTLKTVFLIRGWESVDVEAVMTVHCSMPSYITELSILGFWYPWRVLEPISCGYWGTIIKFWGRQKLHVDFQLWQGWGWVPIIPLFKGKLYFLYI